MEITLNKKNLLFSITYFVSILILLLNQNDTLPMATILRKVKYLYVIVVAFLVVIDGKWKKGSFLPFLALALYFVHNILFGYIITNSVVAYETKEHADMMLWFLLFIIVTVAYIAQNHYFKEYIKLSYYAAGLQMIIAAIKYHSDLVNPIWGLKQTFLGDQSSRYKTTFGFVHAGYTANAALIVLTLSIFYFELYRHEYKTMSKSEQYIFVLSLIGIDGITGLIIISAAERGAMVSFAMALLVYVVFVLFRVRLETRTKAITWIAGILTIAVCIASGLVAYLWNNSNRNLNITVNYPVFKQLGSFWTGMGWVDNACFHADISSFGIKTSSLDLYYVYVFFTTGVIGSILIGGALLLIIIKICCNKKTNVNITAIGFSIAWIFLAFWECTMFSYKFISCYMTSVIMIVAMYNDCCLEEKNG